MIDTIKVYLDSNLNMVNAAKTLYIHRNTLIQRLDKFRTRNLENISFKKMQYCINFQLIP